MDDRVRQKLIELIRINGPSLANDPRRLEGMLRDAGGDNRREIFVIMLAVKARVTEELLALSSGTAADLLAVRLVKRLVDEMAMADEAAVWAVNTWTEALLGTKAILPVSTVIEAKPVIGLQPVSNPISLLNASMGSTSITSLSMEMIHVPGAVSFPTGVDDSGRCTDVNYPFYMAKTEVTYAQWKKVYDWAVGHGYTFANPGQPGKYDSGHSDHPVTRVSWRDCMIWCNALTEYSNSQEETNYSCVYRYHGNIVKDVTNETACDHVDADANTKGYRLPTSMEWELAARYIDGNRWTPGNYASGRNNREGHATSDVAWYDKNSDGSTHPVGTKAPNALGIYDMSGNVWEWCFDWYLGEEGSYRVIRGGSWNFSSGYLQVGYADYNSPSDCGHLLGFCPMRTL